MVAATPLARVDRSQRFTAADPCPVCRGWQHGGHGQHCYGFWSQDRRTVYCTEISNGDPKPNPHTGAYAHRLGPTSATVGGVSAPALAAVRARPHRRSLHALIPHTLRDGWHETARYPYYDAAGQLTHYRVRYEPPPGVAGKKRVLPWQPVATEHGQMWACDEDGLTRTLYRLPALLAAPTTRPVFIVEGEPCCDALTALGLLATTNPGGAGKWDSVPAEIRYDALRARVAVPTADHDTPGGAHVRGVAADLAGVAERVHVVELPGLNEHEDVKDWLDAGHTVLELLELALATPPEARPTPVQALLHNAQPPQPSVDPDALHRAQAAYTSEHAKVTTLLTRAQWKRAVLRNKAMPPNSRNVAAALRDELARHRVPDGGELLLYMPQLEEASGLGKKATHAGLDTLTAPGGPLTKRRQYDRERQITRVYVRPTALWAAPDDWRPPAPRTHGGARMCPDCASTDVQTKRETATHCTCRNCGRKWDEKRA